MIADLDPNEGEVWLSGRSRSSMSASDWRRQVTYVGAESGWWADVVGQHFAPNNRSEFLLLSKRLALRDGVLDAPVSQLSTGEKQRVSLIRAVLLHPPILLLDEPTGPLDEDSAVEVEKLLRELMAAGTTILLVTHNPSQAGRLGDKRYNMTAGRMQPL